MEIRQLKLGNAEKYVFDFNHIELLIIYHKCVYWKDFLEKRGKVKDLQCEKNTHLKEYSLQFC